MKLGQILLIEDNLGDAQLVRLYLTERFGASCGVRHELTLRAGLHALGEGSVDVVLLDLGLPDSTGLQGYLQVQQAAPRTPVVILTGDSDEDSALQALRVGAQDYLSKSSADAITLVRAMRHAVQRSATSEALRASERRLRAIVDSANEGMAEFDGHGRISWANARLAALLGIAPETEATDTSSADGDRAETRRAAVDRQLPACVPASHRAAWHMLMNTPPGARSSCELQLRRADDRALWVVAAAGSFLAADGRRVVLLLTDIGLRRLAETELALLKQELETRVLQRTQHAVAATQQQKLVNYALAHDLRNPLSGILGLVHLTRQDLQAQQTQPGIRRLQLIERCALDMNELITGLLSLTETDRQPLQTEMLDLSALAHTVAEQLAQADPQARAPWSIEPDMQACGDRALVLVVLHNLMHNAWKYAAPGRPLVAAFGRLPPAAAADAGEAGGATTAAPGQRWYYVSDNGIGFDPALAASLFEPFQRLPNAAGISGHGIGLATVKRVIERHGGQITADSRPGIGTTFTFSLGVHQ